MEQEDLQENTSKKWTKKAIIKEIFDWVMVVVIAVAISNVINHFVILNAYIPSSSMVDTLEIGDRVIGLRTAYWFSSPKRGDIVIFPYPDNEEETFIKRVIGLPGEKVEIRNGYIYIDDSEEPLTEPYVYGEPDNRKDGVYQVPEDCYFMLGDNRNNSRDSAAWNHPYVEEKKILAKAVLRYYPSLKILE